MVIDVLTIFPGLIQAYLGESIMKRAIEAGVVEVNVHNLRDYARDRHRSVDDYPFGGGPGMVIKPDVLGEAVDSIRSAGPRAHTVLMSPQGVPYGQRRAEAFASDNRRLLLISGRYEGVDERAVKALVDEEISVGDYVLSGGELAALIIIDSVVRLLPGALGDGRSVLEESFTWGILDYPHYTRPREWRGMEAPGVLLGGNHAGIARWRRREALRRTLLRRPDLLEGARLDKEDLKLIDEIKEDEERWE